jgi:hypothetical protein
MTTLSPLLPYQRIATLLSLERGGAIETRSNADKIRKADLARLRGSQSQQPKTVKQEPTKVVDKPKKHIDKYEASEMVRRKLGI